MSDAWNSVTIREFEHVPAAPAVALLRVSGKLPRRHSGAGPRPELVADDGQTIHRFTAIPSPPDDRGVLRAAYSVGSELLAANTSFSLELSDGTVLPLPPPRSGEARLSPGAGVDATRQSVAPVSQANERVGHELLGARQRAARAEAEAQHSAAALAELDTWRGELERRLTDTIDELSAARIGRTQDEAELLRLGGELAEAQAQVELLQAQVTTLTDELTAARAEPELTRATASDG